MLSTYCVHNKTIVEKHEWCANMGTPVPLFMGSCFMPTVGYCLLDCLVCLLNALLPYLENGLIQFGMNDETPLYMHVLGWIFMC